MFSKVFRLFSSSPKLTALLLAHCIFLPEYFGQLWSRTHYQFFPFALIAFFGLFSTRQADQPERWTRIPKLLLGLAFLIFVAALVLRFVFDRNMPLVEAFSFVLLLTAWCSAHRDDGYSRRLTYLSVLPWTTIRLPLNYDDEIIHWLQRVTTSVASKSLHRMDMLHFRDGNMLQFPGKTFMVEEACSGVQSLFTIVFLASLVLCLKRRSIVHGSLLLLAGPVFAGVLNVARIVFIAFAWETWQLDISIGWRHDVLGYGSLLVAAILLLSADSLLTFFSDVVPDVRRPGTAGQFLNPVIRSWNRLVAAPSSGSFTVQTTPPQSRNVASQDIADRRSWPSISETLKPSHLFHFHLGLAESWLFSRNYRQLTGGLPSLMSVCGTLILVWWLRHASIDPILANYEQTYNLAVTAKDPIRQENALRALDSLRPTEPQYRFRLAQFMLEQGRTSEGLTEILKLAPENALGSIEARMWLVKQATSRQPLQALTLDQIEAQLKMVLSQSANHLEAHLLMAALYKQRNELRLAEHHLSEAARLDPEKNLDLAILKTELGRSTEDVQNYANRAIAAFTDKLKNDRTNAAARVRLSEALIIAGQESQARELLTAGVAQQPDAELKTALSNLDLRICDRRLRESPLNRDACLPVVVEALKRDPSSLAGLILLANLQSIGAEIDGAQLVEPLQFWTEKVSEDPENQSARMRLSQIKAVSGQLSDAAEILLPAMQKDQRLALPYARIIMQMGQHDEAVRILEPVMSEMKTVLASSPNDLPATAKLADCLVVLKKADDAHRLLSAVAEKTANGRIPRDSGLAALFGQSCLIRYDQMTSYRPLNPIRPVSESATVSVPGDLDVEMAIELLTDAMECPSTTSMAIDRLSLLSLSDHPAASRVEEVIRQIRLEGDHGAAVLNHLGTHALILKRYEKAKNYLELANTQSRGRNPMVLNNLATCLVRTSKNESDTLRRSLELANATLAILPDHPDALSTRGEVYVAMQQWNDAIADLSQSLTFRKSNPDVHRLLETAFRAINDTQMADEHAKRAAELENPQTKS